MAFRLEGFLKPTVTPGEWFTANDGLEWRGWMYCDQCDRMIGFPSDKIGWGEAIAFHKACDHS